MKWLFVLAHPDDETDMGGTIWKLSSSGHQVAVAILVGKVSARRNRSDTLESDERRSMSILGVAKVYHADFPNIKMNAVPYHDLVEFIENCAADWQAEAIVTHHTADVNIDHAETGRAAIASCRLFQSRSEQPRLRLFLMCETAGASEWALDSAKNRMIPNFFVRIGKAGLDVKLKAHSCYVGVSRAYPHPYSNETYEGLAAYRGTQCGCEYAEAFDCVFRSSQKIDDI